MNKAVFNSNLNHVILKNACEKKRLQIYVLPLPLYYAKRILSYLASVRRWLMNISFCLGPTLRALDRLPSNAVYKRWLTDSLLPCGKVYACCAFVYKAPRFFLRQYEHARNQNMYRVER